MPEHPPPLQPEKPEPKSAVAVSLTTLPLTKVFEQLRPQNPPGFIVTVPLPLPTVLTESANHGREEAFTNTLTAVP